MNLTKEEYIILRKLMFRLLRRKMKDSEMEVVYKMQCIISEELKELSKASNPSAGFCSDTTTNSSIQK